jgi:hypothetical protein
MISPGLIQDFQKILGREQVFISEADQLPHSEMRHRLQSHRPAGGLGGHPRGNLRDHFEAHSPAHSPAGHDGHLRSGGPGLGGGGGHL